MPLTRVSSLLVDTNVWLDYFMGEGPELGATQELVHLAYDGTLGLMYAPTTAKDLFYLIPRRLRRLGPDDGTCYRPAAWGCVEKLMEIAVAALLSFPECELARMLRRTFPDFEDNLVIAAAETAKADYVVTQDRPLLAAMPEACVTPTRALELVRRGMELSGQSEG